MNKRRIVALSATAAAIAGIGTLFYRLYKAKAPFDQSESNDHSQRRALIKGAISYKLELALKEFDGYVGAVEIVFELVESAALCLDFLKNGLKSLAVNGSEATVERRNGRVELPAVLLVKGINTVFARFECEYDIDRFGLFRFETGVCLFADGKGASRTFPCFDQSDLQSCVRLRLHLPSQWAAVANERAAAPEAAIPAFVGPPSPDCAQLGFITTKKMPLSALALVAGPFRPFGAPRFCLGAKVEFYCRDEAIEQLERRVEELFVCVEESLRFFKEELNARYPFNAICICLLPGDFPAKGFPGCVLISEDRLGPSEEAVARRAESLCRAIAEVWFGGVIADGDNLFEAIRGFVAERVYSRATRRIPIKTLSAETLSILLNAENFPRSLRRANIGKLSRFAVNALSAQIGGDALIAALRRLLREYSWKTFGKTDFENLFAESDRRALSESLEIQSGIVRIRRFGDEIRVETTKKWENVSLLQFGESEVKTVQIRVESGSIALNPKTDFYILNADFAAPFICLDDDANLSALLSAALPFAALLAAHLNAGNAALFAGAALAPFHALSLKLLAENANESAIALIERALGDGESAERFAPTLCAALCDRGALGAAARFARRSTPEATLERIRSDGRAAERLFVALRSQNDPRAAAIGAQCEALSAALSDETALRNAIAAILRGNSPLSIERQKRVFEGIVQFGGEVREIALKETFAELESLVRTRGDAAIDFLEIAFARLNGGESAAKLKGFAKIEALFDFITLN